MPASDRLFTFLFPKKDVCEEKELYYHDENGKVTIHEGSLLVPQGETLCLDGYFNVFDTAPYYENTVVRTLTYHLKVKGEGCLRLFFSRPADSAVGYSDLLQKEIDFSSQKEEVTFSIALPEEVGTLWLSLSAKSDCTFFGGCITAKETPLREVKIGIAITTFHREEYVKRNVAALTSTLPKDTFGVFVVDNGNTLSPEDVRGARLFPSQNLGGSGGFTRGILEVTESGEFTHILLTDDDISFDSEIFLRTAAVLRYLTQPDHVIIGASMLFSDRPYLQMEMGAEWTGSKLVPHNKKQDLRSRAALVQNAAHLTADYSGWWFNCFSVALAKKIGLPLPFFIKIDDVEYCLRANANILLLNGIGVWHEDFNYKFSSALDYYYERNKLILNALHRPKLGALYHFKNLLYVVAKQLSLHRYRSLDLVFKAYSDFLAGANVFQKTDAMALHKSLAALGEKQISRADLEKQGYDLSRPILHSEPYKGASFVQAVTLNGYLFPAQKQDYRIVDLTAGNPNDFYRAKHVVQFNPITQTGFVTKRSLWVLIKTCFRLVGYFFKLLFRHTKASRSYRALFPDLISEKQWKKRLGMTN